MQKGEMEFLVTTLSIFTFQLKSNLIKLRPKIIYNFFNEKKNK